MQFEVLGLPRWCQSADVVATTDVPSVVGDAWVRPVFVGQRDQPSGLSSTPAQMTCDSYNSSANNHLAMADNGSLKIVSCELGLQAACCTLR